MCACVSVCVRLCTCTASSVWTHTTGMYYEACGGSGGDEGHFVGLTVEQAQSKCCADSGCAGFSFKDGAGYFKTNANCGTVSGEDGYTRTAAIPAGGGPADITVQFSDVHLFGNVSVFDIWAQAAIGACACVASDEQARRRPFVTSLLVFSFLAHTQSTHAHVRTHTHTHTVPCNRHVPGQLHGHGCARPRHCLLAAVPRLKS
jgi:hypothetical protein